MGHVEPTGGAAGPEKIVLRGEAEALDPGENGLGQSSGLQCGHLDSNGYARIAGMQ